jgi:formylglycine-generating enzyme required for sulfatase activity
MMYYGQSPEENPTGPIDTGYRSLRGGGWTVRDDDCRVAKRFSDGYEPDGRYYIYGFRVCATVGKY